MRLARFASLAFLWLVTLPALGLDADALESRHMQQLEETAPDFLLRDGSGRTFHLTDLRGHAVILHFWATWCKPCRKELPTLQAMASRLAGSNAVVIAVAIDAKSDAASVRRYAVDLGVTIPVYLASEGTISDRYWSWGVPVTYLIDPEGRLIARSLGPRDWASASMRALIGQFVAPPSPGGAESHWRIGIQR